jgi:aminobenzoyl-glutamate utilization protein B
MVGSSHGGVDTIGVAKPARNIGVMFDPNYGWSRFGMPKCAAGDSSIDGGASSRNRIMNNIPVVCGLWISRLARRLPNRARRGWLAVTMAVGLGALLGVDGKAQVLEGDRQTATEESRSSTVPSGSNRDSQGQEARRENLLPPKQTVMDWLAEPDVIARFGAISDRIWEYAELGLQEFRSAALLIDTLEAEGFKVEKGLAGMPTCFVASYGSGSPVIGILAEYDALPMISQRANSYRQQPLVEGGPGHGCGHNQMAASATAAAIAVRRAMQAHQLTGTIRLFGSPGEEMLVSRPFMIRAGLFADVDAVINNHTSSDFSTDYGVRGSALMSVMFTFTGKTAHSAGSPWSGRSALDAVEIMNVATNFLREHLHYSHRMHYVIPQGGDAPNVVPDTASVWYFLRNNDENLMDMFSRVQDCARGAALATGTKLASMRVLAATHQAHHNRTLAEVMQQNIEWIGMPNWTKEEDDFARILQAELGSRPVGRSHTVERIKIPEPTFTGGSSSDHGDVTLVVPTATLRFPGIPPGVFGHHWSTVACGYGGAAHKGLNVGAKAMAATAMDLLTRPELLVAIRKEFDEYSEKHPYQSFLPEEAVPPLDINQRMMEQFRPLIEQALRD